MTMTINLDAKFPVKCDLYRTIISLSQDNCSGHNYIVLTDDNLKELFKVFNEYNE